LLPGARNAPVGTDIGIVLAPNAKFSMKLAGNWAGEICDCPANGWFAFWPAHVTKWFCHAVNFPEASTAPFRKCHPAGR
jgi:hypothetical protein